MFRNIFENKLILVTGHTGFKGSWLSLWLNRLGANVIGLSDNVPTIPSNFVTCKVSDFLTHDYRIDLTNFEEVYKVLDKHDFDFVFHLGAQALVRPSYKDPKNTFLTNSVGTINILEALRRLNAKTVAILITSDKAYDNVEWFYGYRETDSIGGKDPYSASKGMAELAIKSYFHSFFKNNESNTTVAVTRAGNVIGGGDWALDRIIPDCVNAWSQNDSVKLRSPNATRPWQHVLEPLSGYLNLASRLFIDNNLNGEAFNFGPSSDNSFSVMQLINEMSKYWDKVNWVDVSDASNLHEAGLLKLNCDKALQILNWKQTLGFEETVMYTVDWYKNFYEGNFDMLKYTELQIDQFVEVATKKRINWAIE